jgi:hypothetical protein
MAGSAARSRPYYVGFEPAIQAHVNLVDSCVQRHAAHAPLLPLSLNAHRGERVSDGSHNLGPQALGQPDVHILCGTGHTESPEALQLTGHVAQCCHANSRQGTAARKYKPLARTQHAATVQLQHQQPSQSIVHTCPGPCKAHKKHPQHSKHRKQLSLPTSTA